jgi:hypothetical protein
MPDGPDLVFLGQIMIDDIVPATPGPWRRVIGGSALYGIAGARLWIDPARIGLAARRGRDYPFDVEAILRAAGICHVALSEIATDHLIEWVIYEADGCRRSLPRNVDLHDIGAEGPAGRGRYIAKLLEVTPTAAEIPPSWLPAAALHLCPQAGTRHPDSLRALAGQIGRISLDPSPRYSRALDARALVELLPHVACFLPSEAEIQQLIAGLGPARAVRDLQRAGFSEVVLKRGCAPVLVASADGLAEITVEAAPEIDATGAGDAFCGAYAACRLTGHSPVEAARRAAATAALVVGCQGGEAALGLTRPDALPDWRVVAEPG